MSDPGELTPQPAPRAETPTPPTSMPAEPASPRAPSNGRAGSNGHATPERWQQVALDAHSDMEAYRRVLAAAVANEKNALSRVDESQKLTDRVQTELSRESHARGLAEGRVGELERERDLFASRMRTAEAELREARREHEFSLESLHQRLVAANQRIAQLEAQSDALRRERHGLGFLALRLRSRVLVVAAVAAYLLALGCFTRMVMELLGTQSPPLKLLAVTLVLFVTGIICHGQAASALARELRQAE